MFDHAHVVDLNHIRFVELVKKFHKSSDKMWRCRSGADTGHLIVPMATTEESFSMTRARI